MIIHPHLLQLREKVDAFMKRVAAANPESISCGPGCHDCCKVDLSVFPVEAEPMAAQLARLNAGVRTAISDRITTGQHCALLVDDRCAVYEQRPLICRSQGLPLLLEDRSLTVCPENFPGTGSIERLPAADILNLKTLNVVLSVLHQAHIKDAGAADERIRIADLPHERVHHG